ncbi:myosin-2 heavy chain-like isoform X2 [Branchiostoma lanceolatum]
MWAGDSRDAIRQLRGGINGVLDVLNDVVDPGKDELLIQVFRRKLENVEQGKWKNIREKYISDDGNNKDEEIKEQVNGNSSDPWKLFIDLINRVEKCRGAVLADVTRLSEREVKWHSQRQFLQQDATDARAALSSTKYKYDQLEKELKTTKATLVKTQEILIGKSSEIESLRRAGTVEIWGMEQTRFTDEAARREEELQARLKQVEQEKEDIKERLQKKLRDQEHQLKLLRLKDEVAIRKPKDEVEQDLEDTRRKLFKAEKDLLNAEREMQLQQKYFVGFMRGLQRDYKILLERREQNGGVAATKDIKNMQEKLDEIHDAAREGKLAHLRADMPTHYLALDKDVGAHPLGNKLSTNFRNGLLEPSSASRPSSSASLRSNAGGSTPNVSGRPTSSYLRPEVKNGLKASSTPNIRMEEEKKEKDHPDLVHKTTGRIDMIAVKAQFPYLLEQEVREHYQHFKQYDRNNDQHLDLAEVLQALTATIGYKFMPSQIKEVMSEVDQDGNKSIDFFEYLTISQTLIRKAGKAELFKTELAREEGRAVSKMCVIQ